jgi:uncharacterized protein YgbK (DUF1537 family)
LSKLDVIAEDLTGIRDIMRPALASGLRNYRYAGIKKLPNTIEEKVLVITTRSRSFSLDITYQELSMTEAICKGLRI